MQQHPRPLALNASAHLWPQQGGQQQHGPVGIFLASITLGSRAISTSCILLAPSHGSNDGKKGPDQRAVSAADDSGDGSDDGNEEDNGHNVAAGRRQVNAGSSARGGRDGAAQVQGARRSPATQGSKHVEALEALKSLNAHRQQKVLMEDSLEQHVARQVMADPMARVLASRGMPLGISFDAISAQAAKSQPGANTSVNMGRTCQQPALKDAEEHEEEGEDAEAEGEPSGKAAGSPVPEPRYQMEALDDIFMVTQAQCGLAAAAAAGASGSSAAPAGVGALRGAAGAGGAGGGGDHGEQGGKGDEEEEAPGLVLQDSWATTREGPAEIARRLVENNRAAGTGSADQQQLEEEEDDPSKEPLDPLQPVPGEHKYKTLEQMSTDIKGLDEVFEVLAQVPWLDEDVLEQKELKGVAMVGLLGTLEEVGFSIRHHVERIWAGDHDEGMIIECESARDQAALISILFHTKKIHDEYGPGNYLPAPKGGTQGTAAGGSKGPAISESLLQQLMTAKKDEGSGGKG